MRPLAPITAKGPGSFVSPSDALFLITYLLEVEIFEMGNFFFYFLISYTIFGWTDRFLSS